MESSHIGFPTTASSSGRHRSYCTCCCFSRQVHWASVQAYPIIDSTPLASCHIKRERQHRTMRGWAAKGKCTMGWFYGFKLHLVINDKGEIIQWKLTPGNVDDREPLKDKRFTREVVWKTLRRQGVYQSEPL